jgi:hypothetical protein
LQRLKGRPQFICHEQDVRFIERYIAATGVDGAFTFAAVPFRNHDDRWILRDTPTRRAARQWLVKAAAANP